MRKTFLPFSPPNIGAEEINEVVDTLNSDWITTGPKVKKFEKEFAGFVRSPGALAVNSCTAALHLSLKILRVGEGDYVITTPMTFCSSVNVIEHVGAIPVLVDVLPDTLNIDPDRIADALEGKVAGNHLKDLKKDKVKAVIPVHLYGHPCDMDSIIKIAKENRLALIEDAAHALPAYFKEHIIGAPYNDFSLPCFSCFSFYATKNITTAEGGMLTGSTENIEKASVWSLHGLSRDAWKRYEKEGSWAYDVVFPGYKYNMTDMQASLGLWQLKKLPQFQRRRREIVRMYNEAFGEKEEIQLPVEKEEVTHAWHLYVIRLNLDALAISRNEFIEKLKEMQIGTSVHFIPIHLHSYYREKYGYKPDDFPIAYENYLRMISLPLHPRMTDEDVVSVIEAVTDVLQKSKR